MQLTVDTMTGPDAVQAITAAVRALDPGAKVAADPTRRQLHASGRLAADALVQALAAAGFAASLTSSGVAAAPRRPPHRCRCGCVFGQPCACG